MKAWPVFVLAVLTAPVAAQQATAVAGGGGHSSATITVGFGHTARFNGIRIRPIAIVEDSRCPRMVTCVWRGRLKARFRVTGGRPIELEDGKPVAFRGGTLTLVNADPVSRQGEKISPASYRFRIRFER